MEPSGTRELYQFKVILRGSSPQIWRRIQIWKDYTLDQLHSVLQSVMGWENRHLYEFRIAGVKYRAPHPENEAEVLNTNRTRMSSVLSSAEARLEYIYDFGDCWQHDLFLESILLPSLDTLYPRCLAGERNCPPEDVGGTGGYAHYLRAMADSKHDEHEDMMAWRGPFDPEEFSIENVNRRLGKKFGPARRQRS